jgi:hypothetical protein
MVKIRKRNDYYIRVTKWKEMKKPSTKGKCNKIRGVRKWELWE